MLSNQVYLLTVLSELGLSEEGQSCHGIYFVARNWENFSFCSPELGEFQKKLLKKPGIGTTEPGARALGQLRANHFKHMCFFESSRKLDALVKSNSTSKFPLDRCGTAIIKLSIRNHFPSISVPFCMFFSPSKIVFGPAYIYFSSSDIVFI